MRKQNKSRTMQAITKMKKIRLTENNERNHRVVFSGNQKLTLLLVLIRGRDERESKTNGRTMQAILYDNEDGENTLAGK